MKKIILPLFFVCILTAGAFGVSVTLDGALGLNNYIQYFEDKEITPSLGTIWMNGRYFQDRDSDIYKQATALGTAGRYPNNTIGFIIAAQYTSTVKIRPAEATEMLPEGKASDIRIAAATYAKLQEIKFLDPQNSERIGRYEQMINTLKQRNNITQAEIETSLRTLIAAVVNEEFNKISFSMSNDGIRKGYNAVLTRAANNQYILEYTGVYQGKPFSEKLSATTLDALLTQMRNNTADFDQACVNTVRTQAVLIPAVTYEIINNTTALTTLINILTDFYINPTQASYRRLLNEYSVYRTMARRSVAEPEYASLRRTLTALNPALADRVARD